MRCTRSRFTLIELLVVIAIISVLASMLLPALNRAKDKARTTLCKNQQKQIFMAFMLHADDNNGWLHKGKRGNSIWWFSDFTNGAFDPYLGEYVVDSNPYYTARKLPDILVCPSDDKAKEYLAGGWQARYHHPISYGVNEKSIWQTSHPGIKRKIQDVHPERLFLFDKCTSGKNQSGWTKDVAERTALFRTYYSETHWFKQGNGANRHGLGASVVGTNADGSVHVIDFLEFSAANRGYEGWDMD